MGVLGMVAMNVPTYVCMLACLYFCLAWTWQSIRGESTKLVACAHFEEGVLQATLDALKTSKLTSRRPIKCPGTPCEVYVAKMFRVGCRQGQGK